MISSWNLGVLSLADLWSEREVLLSGKYLTWDVIGLTDCVKTERVSKRSCHFVSGVLFDNLIKEI